MMQTAESFPRNSSTRSSSANPGTGCFFLESKMGSVFVVVTDVIRDKPLQMSLVDRDDVVEQGAGNSRPTARQSRFAMDSGTTSEQDRSSSIESQSGPPSHTLHRDQR